MSKSTIVFIILVAVFVGFFAGLCLGVKIGFVKGQQVVAQRALS